MVAVMVVVMVMIEVVIGSVDGGWCSLSHKTQNLTSQPAPHPLSYSLFVSAQYDWLMPLRGCWS